MSQEAADIIADSLALLFDMTGIGRSHFVLATVGETGQNIFTSLTPADAAVIATQVAAVLETRAGSRHPDDLRVYAFADVIIEKLNKKRAEGRDGWQDPEQCSVNKLYSEYTCKVESNPEDFLDVAILAMMLHFRTQEA